MSLSGVEDDYAKIDYSSKLRANNLAPRINEVTSVRRQETAEFEELEQFVKEEEKKPNFESTNRCTKASTIKWGLLILFILLTCTLATLFSLLYLRVLELKQEINAQKEQIQYINSTINSLSNNGSTVVNDELPQSEQQERTTNDKKVMMEATTDINQLKENILMDTIISQNKTISEKEATIDRHVANIISQLKNKVSELSKKVDEQNGVIDRQGGEIKNLGDNLAALLKKTNDDTKTIDGLNESIKKLQQTRTDVLNKTLNRMATELVNPYMLIFGEYNDKMQVLNPEEDILIECKLNLPSKVRNHGAAIVNNELYIFGGENGSSTYQPTNKCFKLDKSHKWIKVASMKENRRQITKCSVVFNSEIWVFGGEDASYNSLKTVEKYNPEANTWTYMREMIEYRAWCVASIIDRKIYVSGGYKNSIEVYDPVKNEWEIFSNMPHNVLFHSAVVDESSLLIIGGYQNGIDSDEVWKINVEDPKKEWKKMPNLNQGRSHNGAAKLRNKIIVIGKPGIEIFDGNEWTIRSSRNLGFISSMVLLTKQSEVDLLRNVCF